MTWKDDEIVLRKRWDELHERREAILARATPLREERDAAVQAHDFFLRKMDAAIKQAEQGLFEIENERAHVARQLGAKNVRVG